MELIKVNKYWVWGGDYTTKQIPKAAKFKWNSDKNARFKPNLEIDLNVWWTDDISNAVKLIEYTTGDVLKELQIERDAIDKKISDSNATDSNLKIPVPKGFEYYGYQKAGIEYGVQNKSVLIADEMGLGKTIQAIGIINVDKTIKKVLIVCPSSLKTNWKKELATWLTRKMTVAVLSSKDTKPVKADILIINYDILASKKVAWIHKRKYHAIIADEAHYVKNNKAQRSKAYYRLAKATDRKIMLTGTPILNRPSEIYHIINSLGFSMSWWAFTNRYCDPQMGPFGRDISGSSNMEELQVKLRSTMMVRRLKADVLQDLPPKQRQIIALDPSKYKDYIDAEQQYLGSINKANPFKSVDEDEMDSYEDRVDMLKEMPVTHIAEMARLRHETAMAKVSDVIKHIESVLDQTDKVIVFAHHRDVIEALHEAFDGRAVKLYGGMKEDEKNESVEKFQNDSNTKLFVGSIKAAGVGLTLTAASTVIFAELDWTPANLTQAEDRAHRIGQVNSVLVQHIVIDGSIDSNLAKRIVGKQAIIDRALNMNKVVEHRKQAENATLIHGEVESAKKFVKTINGAKEYTVDERELVLVKLQYLAGISKGVHGVGFNRKDSSFGHVLARKKVLTNRQAYVGEVILNNHKDQF